MTGRAEPSRAPSAGSSPTPLPLTSDRPVLSAASRARSGTAATDGATPTSDAQHQSPFAWLLLKLVAVYRSTAPFRAPRCRFHPSCSTYAVVAIERHGAFRGSWLAVRRLGRCHPWNPGGVDHVPPRK
jgi:uncharacterized protein